MAGPSQSFRRAFEEIGAQVRTDHESRGRQTQARRRRVVTYVSQVIIAVDLTSFACQGKRNIECRLGFDWNTHGSKPRMQAAREMPTPHETNPGYCKNTR